MNGELLRIIEAIHLEKDIETELIFETIENAMVAAIQKKVGEDVPISCIIDRNSGEMSVTSEVETGAIDLGRIAAQTAKQVIIQSLREAENKVVFSEFEGRVGQLVLGSVQRIEGGALIVNISKAEAIIPRAERVRGEMYSPGDRIRGIITEVKQVGMRVKILLSRVTPDLVKRLFELEVPEVNEGVIEIRRIAREPGYRTKIAVHSNDPRVDCVGACVGIRGTRIKAITDELNGEKIDIIRWSESDEDLIANALRPAQLASLTLEPDTMIAKVVVPDDQLALAIGRKGQNVRLATRLTGWDIKIEGVTQMPHSARDETGALINEAAAAEAAALAAGEGAAEGAATGGGGEDAGQGADGADAGNAADAADTGTAAEGDASPAAEGSDTEATSGADAGDPETSAAESDAVRQDSSSSE